MKLTQIELRTKFKHSKELEFNKESWCVPELYWSFLKNYNTNKTKKCVVRLDDDWGVDKEKITDQANVIQINLNFDFEAYFKAPIANKKKMQLDVLHDGMMKMAEIKDWEINPLLDAYNNCIKKDLKYEFFVSEKPKASPNRKYHINFWCEWDIEMCRIYYVLFNKDREEQYRELLVEKESFFGEFAYYVKYKWVGNKKVTLKNEYRTKEVFNVDIVKSMEKTV